MEPGWPFAHGSGCGTLLLAARTELERMQGAYGCTVQATAVRLAACTHVVLLGSMMTGGTLALAAAT